MADDTQLALVRNLLTGGTTWIFLLSSSASIELVRVTPARIQQGLQQDLQIGLELGFSTRSLNRVFKNVSHIYIHTQPNYRAPCVHESDKKDINL